MACPIDWNVEIGPQPIFAMNGVDFANADDPANGFFLAQDPAVHYGTHKEEPQGAHV